LRSAVAAREDGGMTASLARACAAHPLRTFAAWGMALVLAFAVIATSLGDVLTTEGEVTNDPESELGYQLIGEHFPSSGDDVHEVVIVRSTSTPADREQLLSKAAEVDEAIEATGVVHRTATYEETRDPSLLSPSGNATLVTVTLGFDPEDAVEQVIEVVEDASGGGFETFITGEFTADRDFTTLSEEDLQKGEFAFGLPAALVVMILVFGAVVAGLVPVGLAVVAIVTALGLTALVGQVFELSVFVVNMLTGMGLALGTDYSLFVVSRYREERRRGLEKLDAIAMSGATASRAVLFSGTAFVLAMIGMVLVPDTILRSLAVGAILVGITAVLAALTLLPALLSLLGDRVNALRIPWLGRRVEASAGAEGRVWSRAVRGVMRVPVVSLVASVALLVAAAVPVLDLETGLTGVRTLPDRFPAKQGFLALEQEFGVGTVDTVQVVVGADDVREQDVAGAIERLAERIGSNASFRDPDVSVSPDGQAALVESLVEGDSRDERTLHAVERLRAVDVPAAFGDLDADVYVTGESAEVIDYQALTSFWLPIVFVFVLALSFVLLTVAFRSLTVPAVAIVLNLLSIGAAYGLLVLVFQKGVGNELFGFEQVEVIAAWLPLFLFSVLFGLSMDYHVFLLSRIRERHAHGVPTGEAVAGAIGSTARLITGAALIIIVVFVGFASGDQVEFQQMGFGVAVSLLIDATLIRLVLLPAAMQLLGEHNWYLPRRLGWLPHVEIEGRSPGS
jgi:RND superfamily putative drug exporter